jgi:hypothetical protein
VELRNGVVRLKLSVILNADGFQLPFAVPAASRLQKSRNERSYKDGKAILPAGAEGREQFDDGNALHKRESQTQARSARMHHR